MPSSTFAPGHVLADRYRIVELLGVGHTAEVYAAQDLSLNRTVVVKVLLANLAAHEELRRAFRDHIVRSATLSHPHLARVLDGGQEAGSIFMISEYLSGGSFEDVLASGRRLSVDDVARLGRDVSSALAYVHANGFVHGSLSPSKLLFDDEGRVRLSDIALAGLNDQYRERLSFDDVRYLSPEQVLDETVGPKTDVYALALILFEAATGTTPFDGMTPEAVLRSRLKSPLPVRPELGTLDMLLAQAAVPDPFLRLDAEQFCNRLSAVVKDGAPLVVAPVRDNVPLLQQFTPVERRTSIGFRPPSADQIVGAGASVPPVTHQFPSPQSARPSRISPLERADEFGETRHGGARGLDDLPRNRTPRRRRLGFLAAAVLIIVAAVAGAVVWKFNLLTPKHTVPPLAGLSYQQASNLLKGDGFTLTVAHHANSSTVPANDIVSQVPASGTSAKSGLDISVTVSDGPRLVTLPTNLIGEDCVSATAQLLKLRVTAQCPSSASIMSRRIPSGRIAEVLYHSTRNPVAVPIRSTVILALSTGPPVVATTTTTSTVPATTTTTKPTATTTTTKSTTTTKPTATTTTTIAGQGLRAIPNVVGQSQAEVYAAFRAAQLYFSTRGPNAGTTKWTTVVSEVPAAGTMVKWHSNVVLNVK